MIPPNKNIFQTPEGYFEGLPGQIIDRSERKKRSKSLVYWSGAVAAALVVGLLVSVLRQQTPQADIDLEANLQPEIEMYINAGYWQAEDILTFADNPDELLDEIILSEWGTFETPEDEQEYGWF